MNTTLRLDIEIKDKYCSIDNISEGIVVVLTCSNLCHYNSTVEALTKKHEIYNQDLILKTLNNDYVSVQGRTIATRINDKLTIISIFAEHFLRATKKIISLDDIASGFNFVRSIQSLNPQEDIYIPLHFGSTMNIEQWYACICIMNSFLKKVYVIKEDNI